MVYVDAEREARLREIGVVQRVGTEAEEEGDIVSDLAVLGESKVHIVFGYEGPDAGQFIPQAEPEVDHSRFER